MDTRQTRFAPGGPGIEPRWTRGTKVAVGTAYSTSSHVWYTLDYGCVTEVYYPTIDSPQIRDLQFLVTDGESFFHDERRNFTGQIDCISEAALGFEVTNREMEGRYSIHKTILGDPHQNCLLVQTELAAPPELLPKLRMYVLCAPHLEIGGWHNNGEILQLEGKTVLIAYKGNTWLAIAATIPFTDCSCGYVGVNDGWTDLADNYRLDWQYDAVLDGNIALTGGLDLTKSNKFTLALAFGTTRHNALSTLTQSLSIPFEQTRETFIRQWERTSKRFTLMPGPNNSKLFERSVNLLLAHEDKTYPGAMIASLSIPWGDEKSDDELGGYHLVWTRDLVKCVSALLTVGDFSTPLRALIYLAVSQREDGGFYQNFWIDGRPHWQGIQLDEVAFPILLAWRLRKLGALGNFDPFSMVRRACGFLIREGPVTAQERWEEASGYSPSTLAVHIAALICAAEFFTERGDERTAEFVRDYADFLESHVERWTVTTQGTLVPGLTRHYIRINPGDIDHCADEDPNRGTVVLVNQRPSDRFEFPANGIVDAGFLELVRYGIRSAHDPIIQDSIRVVDAVLKVDTPFGPCWRRYNHDGYGQREDGDSYNGWGVGRPWPLLTGERGHYELAAGRDPGPYLRAKLIGELGPSIKAGTIQEAASADIVLIAVRWVDLETALGGLPAWNGRIAIDDQGNINIARESFMRADQGRPDVLELFHEDAEVYFPKFGFGFGRNSFLEMVKGFEGVLEHIQHDYDRLTFIPSGDHFVVEGTSQGKMSGKSWAGGKTPGGRFCNVFKFRGGRISSLHVYLDPDYTGEDDLRFRWGKNRQW